MEHLAYALGLNVCDMHMFQLLVGGHPFLQPEVLRAGDVHGCKLMLQGKLLGAGKRKADDPASDTRLICKGCQLPMSQLHNNLCDSCYNARKAPVASEPLLEDFRYHS